MLQKRELLSVPSDLSFFNRFNVLDKKITVQEKSISVTGEKLSVIVYISKTDKYIEIKNNFGHRRIAFSDIDFIFLEYYNSYFYTFQGLFTRGYSDKQLWKNSVALVLRSGKIVPFFEAQLDQTCYRQYIENSDNTSVTNENYLHYGEKAIRVLSHAIHKKYLIIDHTE
ncbi:hypothetical protein [Sinomicrobium weinanense]|nr:hypothetical protein [Sinomicrobium weinanense]MBU3124785.1 hypothetical protein [Sinomicrobium weinanense]